jgi:hypothetical protein
MKTTVKLLALIFIFVTGFAACQKEISVETPLPPSGLIVDSNYLSKIYDIAIDGGIADTFNITTYTYDANKRVIRMRVLSTSISDPEFEDQQYFYNGSDTLPFKAIFFSGGHGATFQLDTTISYFYFNSLGQRIKDSVIQMNNGARLTYSLYYYQYAGDKIFGFAKDSSVDFSGSFVNRIFDTATVLDGNIVFNVKHDDYARTIVSSFSYDHQPSPFAKLSNFKTYSIFPFGETLYDQMPQINNRLKAREEIFNNGISFYIYDEDLTGKYLYKPNGYPYEIYYPDPLDPASIYKVSFVYGSL